MTRPRTDAIHHHVVVNAPIERAFAVFTTRFGDFKPPDHRDGIRMPCGRPYLRSRC